MKIEIGKLKLELKPKLEIEYGFSDGLRVLLFNPSEDKVGNEYKEFLNENSIYVKQCHNSTNFIKEINSNNYNLYFVLDGGNFINHGQNGNDFWKNSEVFNDLLKEKVANGQSLLYMFSGSDNGQCFNLQVLKELTGVEFIAYLSPSGWVVDVEENIGTTIPAEGRIINAKLFEVSEYGKIKLNFKEIWHEHMPKDMVYPALLYNQYGKGKVFSFMFNPLYNDGEKIEEKKVLKHIVEELRLEINNNLIKNSLVSIELEVKNIGSNMIKMKHEIELPEGFTGLRDGVYVIEEDKLIQEFTIEPGELIKLTLFSITPKITGKYQLVSKLYYYSSEDELKLYEGMCLDCVVE